MIYKSHCQRKPGSCNVKLFEISGESIKPKWKIEIDTVVVQLKDKSTKVKLFKQCTAYSVDPHSPFKLVLIFRPLRGQYGQGCRELLAAQTFRSSVFAEQNCELSPLRAKCAENFFDHALRLASDAVKSINCTHKIFKYEAPYAPRPGGKLSLLLPPRPWLRVCIHFEVAVLLQRTLGGNKPLRFLGCTV